MNRGLTVLVKWILIPATLAGVGYAIIGPRLGGALPEKAARMLKKNGIENKAPDPVISSTPAPSETESVRSDGPEIKVNVRAAEPKPRPRRSHRVRHSEPSDAPPATNSAPEQTEPPLSDPAGVGAGVP